MAKRVFERRVSISGAAGFSFSVGGPISAERLLILFQKTTRLVPTRDCELVSLSPPARCETLTLTFLKAACGIVRVARRLHRTMTLTSRWKPREYGNTGSLCSTRSETKRSEVRFPGDGTAVILQKRTAAGRVSFALVFLLLLLLLLLLLGFATSSEPLSVVFPYRRAWRISSATGCCPLS